MVWQADSFLQKIFEILVLKIRLRAVYSITVRSPSFREYLRKTEIICKTILDC